MARTKRTTRTTGARRNARGAGLRPAIRRLAAQAAGTVNGLLAQGSRGRELALAATQQARAAFAAGAGVARVRTADAVTQLERVFEDRVSRTVARLGVPTARDVRALSRQVAALQQSVDQLRRARARA